jgi:hypothetical protein
MLQIILMVLGVVYLFKLLMMNKSTGSNLGLEADALAQWQSHRRWQYIWMIVAGWGSAAFGIVVGLIAGVVMGARGGLTQDDLFTLQIVITILSIIVIIVFWVLSSRQEKKAKALERQASGAPHA